jgi:tetratricopeptide (TPR) repeat protein
VVAETNLTILHYGYAQPTAQGRELRAARNLRLLQRALAASPDDPYLLYQLGVTYKALGDRALAYASLRRVLELDYRSLGTAVLDKLYMKLAQLALASDEFGRAVEYARESLAFDPDNVVSTYLMALGFMFQGDVARAYPYFRRVRESSNTNLADAEDLDAVLDFCRATLGTRA